MAFDPTSIGAVPVSGNNSTQFDPASVGAVPVNGSGNVFQDANSRLGSNGNAKAAIRWLADTGNSIEQPFVSIAATPMQLLAKSVGHPDPYAEGVPGIPGTGLSIPVAPANKAGFYQKAGQLGQIASLMMTPEAAGVSGVVKMGALGAFGGASNAMANGADFNINPFGEGEMPEAMRQGAAFAGILGALGNTARLFSASSKSASGIDDAMAKDIGRLGSNKLSEYIDTAVSSAADNQAPTVDDLVTSDIRKGANILTGKIIPDAGKTVGAARKAAADNLIMYTGGSVPEAGINAVPHVMDDINGVLQEMTGHQFADYGSDIPLAINNYPEGPNALGLAPGESSIQQLPGRIAAKLSNADRTRLENLYEDLQKMSEQPTVQTAQDVVHGLDSNINWDRPAQDPVEGVLRYARGAINRVIEPAAPDLAAANARYGDLKDIEGNLQSAAGTELQKLDLLARRVLYRGESGNAQSVLGALQDEVAPFLSQNEPSYTTKAIVAKWARDTFAGARGESGLSQSISSGDVGAAASGFKSRVASSLFKAAKGLMAPDPEQYAMSIAKGEPYSFVPFMHNIDEFIDSDSAQPWLNSFKTALKSMGVSSSNVGQGAKDVFRMMIFQNLMNSAENNAMIDNAQPAAPASISAPQSMAQPSRPLSSATTQRNQQAVRSLTPARSGQQMSSQARKLGLDSLPNGMTLA